MELSKKKFAPILRLTDLEIGKSESHELSVDTNWVNDILNGLFDELDKDEIKALRPKGEIGIDFEITRKVNPAYQDHVIVHGGFTTTFYTPCIRCLTPAIQKIESEFNACFISEPLSKTPEFNDQMDVFMDNIEMELYTYKSKEINIGELFHEQIHLSLNPFPVHDEACKGLCPKCGEDLNKVNCGHS